MKNRELIYELCERLGYVMEVEKDGKVLGMYIYLDGKLVKINL